MHRLISRLFLASKIWFGISIVAIVLAFLGIIFNTRDFKIGQGYLENRFKNGFPVPVKISFNSPPDSIFEYYKNGKVIQATPVSKNSTLRFEKSTEEFLKADSTKRIFFSKWVALNSFYTIKDGGKFDRDDIEVTLNSNYSFDSTINLKSKSLFLNIFLAFNSFIWLIAMLFISFQVMLIFKALNREISFLNSLYKRLNIIGKIIVLTELVQLIIGFGFSFYYGGVHLNKVFSDNNSHEINLQINPTANFDISIVLLGCTIVVFSFLFKHGNKLEKEQALTI